MRLTLTWTVVERASKESVAVTIVSVVSVSVSVQWYGRRCRMLTTFIEQLQSSI